VLSQLLSGRLVAGVVVPLGPFVPWTTVCSAASRCERWPCTPAEAATTAARGGRAGAVPDAVAPGPAALLALVDSVDFRGRKRGVQTQRQLARSVSGRGLFAISAGRARASVAASNSAVSPVNATVASIGGERANAAMAAAAAAEAAEAAAAAGGARVLDRGSKPRGGLLAAPGVARSRATESHHLAKMGLQRGFRVLGAVVGAVCGCDCQHTLGLSRTHGHHASLRATPGASLARYRSTVQGLALVVVSQRVRLRPAVYKRLGPAPARSGRARAGGRDDDGDVSRLCELGPEPGRRNTDPRTDAAEGVRAEGVRGRSARERSHAQGRKRRLAAKLTPAAIGD
jgi:hypothetical protein